MATDLDADQMESASLALSELVANAVVHAHAPFRLLVDVSGPRVRIEVHDPSTEELIMRPLDPTAVSGRGLRIVAAVTDRWGTSPTDAGKVVWFEVDSPEG